MAHELRVCGVDAIVGLDARGFLFGALLAAQLQIAFVPVRKRGKLPGACVAAAYAKEYGEVRASPAARLTTGPL
jgi:adenine phosphoribosyltransferase